MNFELDLRLRKILRDMSGNKSRLALVVLSIAIGTFTVGTLTRTYAIVSREFRSAYQASNPAHGTVSIWQRFDDRLLANIAAIPEVEAVEGRYWKTVRVKVGPQAWESLKLHLRTDFTDQQIHKVRPIHGAWPPPERTLLLERSSLDMLQANIGDAITLDMQNGIQRTLTVSGVAYDAEQVPSNFVNMAYGYVTAETYTWLLGRQAMLDVLQFTVPQDETGQAQAKQAFAQIDRKLKRAGLTDYNTYVASGKHDLEDIIQAILLTLVVVGLLSLIFSTVLVINIIRAVLARQVAQIGIMKSMGMQRNGVMLFYFGQLFLSGVFALTIAVPFSALAAYQLSTFLGSQLNFDVISYQAPWYAFAVEVLAGVLVPLLAGMIPILNGTQVTVREAIAQTGRENEHFGHGKLDHLLKKIAFLSEPFVYAFRNLLRQKIRFFFTLLTLVLAGAIFIAVSGTRTSLLLTIDNLADYWQQDITLRIQGTRLKKAEQESFRLPDVIAFEGRWATGGARLRPDGQMSGRYDVLGVLPASQFLAPKVTKGRWLLPEDTAAFVLNLPLLKEEPDVDVGDHITFEIDNQTISGPIVGIVTGQAVGASRFMDPIVYLNYDHLTREIRQVGMTNRALIRISGSNPVSQGQMANAVDDHFRRTGISASQKETNTTRRLLIGNIFAVLLSVLFLLAVLFVIVGGLSLTSMMSLSVLERTVEIGILRTMGGGSWFVAQIVLVEGLLIGLLSWAFGTLLAWPLTKFLSVTIGNIMLSTPLDYDFSLYSVCAWLVIVLLLSTLSSILPARNASRLSVREALIYQ
ncbi:MAG: FtsX-like permease family protein [Chloroflexota bacterium]